MNAQVRRDRQMWRWAVENEILPAEKWQALKSVQSLAPGRSAAREPEPIAPVEDAVVAATLPHLTSVVAAMVTIQRLTGGRPQDACNLRGDEIDRTGAVWVFRPGQHKGRWRGKVREVWIGPRAQEYLTPFFDRYGSGYLFSPRASKAEHEAARRATRASKVWPSHQRRYDVQRRAKPRRTPSERFRTRSYGQAIERGAQLAGVPHWSPNQIGHAVGTAVRAKYGLDGAQAFLGHEHASTTEIYAEKMRELAERIAAEVG